MKYCQLAGGGGILWQPLPTACYTTFVYYVIKCIISVGKLEIVDASLCAFTFSVLKPFVGL